MQKIPPTKIVILQGILATPEKLVQVQIIVPEMLDQKGLDPDHLPDSMEKIVIKSREPDHMKGAEGEKSSTQMGHDLDLTLDLGQDPLIQIALTPPHITVTLTDRKDPQIPTLAIIIIRKNREIPREIKIMMRLTSATA